MLKLVFHSFSNYRRSSLKMGEGGGGGGTIKLVIIYFIIEAYTSLRSRTSRNISQSESKTKWMPKPRSLLNINSRLSLFVFVSMEWRLFSSLMYVGDREHVWWRFHSGQSRSDLAHGLFFFERTVARKVRYCRYGRRSNHDCRRRDAPKNAGRPSLGQVVSYRAGALISLDAWSFLGFPVFPQFFVLTIVNGGNGKPLVFSFFFTIESSSRVPVPHISTFNFYGGTYLQSKWYTSFCDFCSSLGWDRERDRERRVIPLLHSDLFSNYHRALLHLYLYILNLQEEKIKFVLMYSVLY